MTKFEKWPQEEPRLVDVIPCGEGTGKKSSREEGNIDYAITIGGDGTILTLLRQLQDYEKTRILPPIITFSQVKDIDYLILIGLVKLLRQF